MIEIGHACIAKNQMQFNRLMAILSIFLFATVQAQVIFNGQGIIIDYWEGKESEKEKDIK